MLKKLRSDYEKFKAQSLLIKTLRVSNTMFVTFSFWNMVLKPDPVTGIDFGRVYLVIPTLLLGLVFAVLILIKPTNVIHYILLPAAVFSFYVTSTRDATFAIFLLPLAAVIILLVVNLITVVANYINR